MSESLVDASHWKGRTVLVTGATGFLGGWLIARLLDYGALVVAIKRRAKGDSQFELAGLEMQCEVIRGEVWDPILIANVFASYPITAVFHTAAQADVNRALIDPIENFRSGIDSTMFLLEQIRILKRDCVIVVSSSDKAYGPQSTPFRESAPLQPHHPYEVAKATQDIMTQSYGKVYGVPAVVTRCANYFGGWDFNWSRIIPGTIQSLCQGEPVVLRSDGQFTRDFLYVEDAVDIQLMLAKRVAEDPEMRGEAFNFSLEVDIEIIDLVRRIGQLMGLKTEPTVNNEAKTEIRFMRVASDKARERLGWAPRFELDPALEATIEWYRRYLRGDSPTALTAEA